MSATDDLLPIPPQPEISEGNQAFHQKAYVLYKWMREKLALSNIEVVNLNRSMVTAAFSGTSDDAVTIVDTGEVSIMIEPGLAYRPGTPARLAYVGDPRIYIDGVTKTYDTSSGAFVFYAQAKAGSGTYADWSLTIIPSGGGLAGLGSNTFTGAQYVPNDAYDATSWASSAAVPTKKAIRDKIESMLIGKTGSVFLWPFPTAPAGAMAIPLVATNLSRSTYSALHAIAQAQGYPWGSGDGSTTFGCPYLQADGTWLQANSNVATTSIGQMPSHDHDGTLRSATPAVSAGSTSLYYTLGNSKTGLAGSGTNNLAAGSRGLWCIWL